MTSSTSAAKHAAKQHGSATDRAPIDRDERKESVCICAPSVATISSTSIRPTPPGRPIPPLNPPLECEFVAYRCNLCTSPRLKPPRLPLALFFIFRCASASTSRTPDCLIRAFADCQRTIAPAVDSRRATRPSTSSLALRRCEAICATSFRRAPPGQKLAKRM